MSRTLVLKSAPSCLRGPLTGHGFDITIALLMAGKMLVKQFASWSIHILYFLSCCRCPLLLNPHQPAYAGWQNPDAGLGVNKRAFQACCICPTGPLAMDDVPKPRCQNG